MSKKNKKNHDQSVYDGHEGFRYESPKYAYCFEYRGDIQVRNSDEEEQFEVDQEVDGKRIRRIQEKWVYGTFHRLIHLEDMEND
jgi:hypothetical protein